MSAKREIEVEGERPYRIHVGAGLLDDGAALAAHLRGRHVLLVSDGNVAPLYAARVVDALSSHSPAQVLVSCIAPGEGSKSLGAFAELIRELADFGATRDACVVALGGGVVGDLAGFVAASWMRGIDCVQLPTTLLAMVDSSVGGKTAVDLPQGKNLVGAFHPPVAVLADTSTLRTLPARELRAGLAEVAKYGAIVDAPFLDWLSAHADALLGGDGDALAEAIARSCAHKAAIVGRDPFERGERALLNFGHTFGHAIETAQDYGTLNHGEAVAVGMVLAARYSARRGYISAADAERIATAIAGAGLPGEIAGLGLNCDGRALAAHMLHDKKMDAGTLPFVLLKGIGAAFLDKSVALEEVAAFLDGELKAP